MKYRILFCLLALINIGKAQNISIQDLIDINNQKNWEGVNNLLLKKGWEYDDSEIDEENEFTETSWAYKKTGYDDRAKGWLYYNNYNDVYPNVTKLHFFNKDAYLKLLNSLKSVNLKFIDSEVKDGSVESKYENSKYTLLVTIETIMDDEYSDVKSYAYFFELTKKESLEWLTNGPRVKYFDDTEIIEIEYILKDGKLNGEVINYYENGNIRRIGTFKNDQREGEFIEYDENGDKSSEYICKNDKIEGKASYYYSNGKIKRIGYFKNGKENGDFVEYETDGTKSAEYKMINGSIEGKQILYHYNGKKAQESNFVNGQKNGNEIIYDSEGRKSKEYSLLNEEYNGKYIDYWENGQPYEVSYYKNGQLNGQSIQYTEAGKVKNKGIYLEGKKNGTFTFNDENGKITAEENYLNDDLSGMTTLFYYDELNPQKLISKTVVNLLNGKENGEYKRLLITENGEKIQDYWNYENGKKNGKFQEFKNDSLFIGAYLKDELNGNYQVYYKVLNTVFGNGSPVLDTNELSLVVTGTYSYGKRTGIWNFYDINEKLYKKCTYLKDKLEGITTEYVRDYENLDNNSKKYVGTIRVKENYVNGLLNGKSEIFGEYEEYNVKCDSINNVKFDYADSCVVSKYILKNIELNFKDNELDGTFKEYGENHILIEERNYEKGQLNGKTFQKIDSITVTGNYQNNLKDGNWKYYLNTSNLFLEENYINGTLEGQRTIYKDKAKLFLAEYKNNDLLKFSLINLEGEIKKGITVNNKNFEIELIYETNYNDEKTIATYTGKSQIYQSVISPNSNNYYVLFEEIDSLIRIESLIKNGSYYLKLKNKSEELGSYNSNKKEGEWRFVNFENNILINQSYLNNKLISENYVFLKDNKPYRGYYEVTNNIENTKEIVKIKKGLREGKTKIYELKTNKLIKTEKYKAGKIK